MKDSISFSEYSAALSCLKKYKHLYVDKIPGEDSVAFRFGTAIHAAIVGALEGGKADDIFEVLWELEKDNGLEYPDNRLDYKAHMELGKELMRKFTDRYLNKIDPIVYEKRMYAEFSELKIEGTPDLLASYEGANHLFDWKTSMYPYHKSKAISSLQLHLYAWLLEKNGYKVDKLVFFVFKKMDSGIQKPLVVDYDRTKTLAMMDDMHRYITALKTLDTYPKNPISCIQGKNKCQFFERCWNAETK